MISSFALNCPSFQADDLERCSGLGELWRFGMKSAADQLARSSRGGGDKQCGGMTHSIPMVVVHAEPLGCGR